MGIKHNVFASKAEKKNFEKLVRTWSSTYRIYHNLPFLNIFTLRNIGDYSDPWNPVPLNLTDREIAVLKKTTVDYTLCNSEDSPVICIEFDGLQNGFSVGTDYYPNSASCKRRPWRRANLELKLRVAHGSLFPYFVVGSQQFKDITPHARLTIVDGIIGVVLSNIAVRKRFNLGFDPQDIGYSKDEFSNLPSRIQEELIQDWVTGVEVEMEFEHNPITRKRAEEDQRLKVTSFSIVPLQFPVIPQIATVKERIAAYDSALMFGTRVVIHSQDHGDIMGEAWLPNFNVPNFSCHQLLEDIAALIALDKLRKKMGKLPRSS